tara:strand:- start:681 stop:1289 length:609 start_codon:yes stop_codon:yes gene_type:complete
MTNPSIKVIDDFLPEDIFYPLARMLMTQPMYMPNATMVLPEEDDGSVSTYGEQDIPFNPHETLFVAPLFQREPNISRVHNIYWFTKVWFDEIEKKLDSIRLWRYQCNCTGIQPEHFQSAFHIDMYEDGMGLVNLRTAILYLNSNNGGTKFEECGTFVESKRNRLVHFPITLRHAGVCQTNKKLRFLLNMAYEVKNNITKGFE